MSERIIAIFICILYAILYITITTLSILYTNNEVYQTNNYNVYAIAEPVNFTLINKNVNIYNIFSTYNTDVPCKINNDIEYCSNITKNEYFTNTVGICNTLIYSCNNNNINNSYYEIGYEINVYYNITLFYHCIYNNISYQTIAIMKELTNINDTISLYVYDSFYIQNNQNDNHTFLIYDYNVTYSYKQYLDISDFNIFLMIGILSGITLFIVLGTFTVSYVLYKKTKNIEYNIFIGTFFTFILILFLCIGFPATMTLYNLNQHHQHYYNNFTFNNFHTTTTSTMSTTPTMSSTSAIHYINVDKTGIYVGISIVCFLVIITFLIYIYNNNKQIKLLDESIKNNKMELKDLNITVSVA